MIEDFNVVFSILLFLLFERDEELLLLLFTRRRRRRLLIILGGSENEDAAWDIFLRNFTRVGREDSSHNFNKILLLFIFSRRRPLFRTSVSCV